MPTARRDAEVEVEAEVVVLPVGLSLVRWPPSRFCMSLNSPPNAT